MISVFKQAVPVLTKIEEAGFEAYFVGGSVRDLLLEKKIEDVDIATSATPEEIKAIFPKTVDVGIQHGTVVVLHNGQSYEVTTFRTESEYEDFRRPNEVSFIRSLKEDLQRRDFTMNAIAMNKEGKIFDYFSGEDDIRKRRIVTVGEPTDRFKEDALRMMRAVRFVSQLSFSIEASTYQSLKKHGPLLKFIAVERIAVEFEKLLLGPNAQNALTILIDTDLYLYLPGLKSYQKELNAFLHLGMRQGFSLEEFWIMLIFCLNLESKELEPFLRDWKLTNQKIKTIKKGLSTLTWHLTNDWKRMDLYYAGEELVLSTEKLYNLLRGKDLNANIESLKEELFTLPIKSRSELELTGKDLMEWYQASGGPWIEEKLKEVEKAVIMGEVQNSRESIREWLLQCNQT